MGIGGNENRNSIAAYLYVAKEMYAAWREHVVLRDVNIAWLFLQRENMIQLCTQDVLCFCDDKIAAIQYDSA